MKAQVSLIICTYNREDLISGCLDSLRDQSIPFRQFEVIVVDNNSTDRTCEIVSNYKDLPNLRLVKETKQGLSYARNRGIEEARCEFLAFLDDDARAHPDYIKAALDLISIMGENVVCFGGPIFPFFTSTKPIWYLDKYETRRDLESQRFLSPGQSFSGSNSIWKRQILIEINGFDVNAGVTGNILRMGDETSAFEKVWRSDKNSQLLYSPNLIVYHWVPAYKMKPSYCFKRNISGGQYLSFQNRQNLKNSARIWILFRDIVKGSLRAMVRVFHYHHWQNWIYEEWPRIFLKIGELLGLMGIHPTYSR